MPHVFIVILNWNLPKDTTETLESVSKSIIKSFQLSVVVVDNGSTDNSILQIKKTIKNLQDKKSTISYKVIQNDENLGFVGGNNIGIDYALKSFADYIVLLNNDTLVDPHLFENMVSYMEKEEKIGVLSPKIYFAKGFEFHKDRYKQKELGQVIWYAGGDIDWNNVYGMNHGVDEVDHGQFEKIQETEFATGCCMMIRAKLIEEVGKLDEKYFLYFEDNDFCQRIKQQGWKVIYYPKGKLWHKVSQSSGIGSNLNDYFITRNRILFGLKYASFRTKVALIRESVHFLLNGRKWQKIGARDFYLRKFGKGSWGGK